MCDSAHLQFLRNMKILSLTREYSKGLDKHLTQNVFAVPNHEAYEAIIFYLLQVLAPENCKDLMRPILPKMKIAFNQKVAEIIKLVSEKYPFFNVPSYPASFFRNPGGSKFLKVLNCLTQLAIFLELQRGGVNVLFPPKRNKNHKFISRQLLGKLRSYNENVLSKELNIHRTRLSEMEVESIKLSAYAAENQKKKENTFNEFSDYLKNVPLEEHMKERLLNTEDENILSEWNFKINELLQDTKEKRNFFVGCRKKLQLLLDAIYSIESIPTSPSNIDGADIFTKFSENQVESMQWEEKTLFRKLEGQSEGTLNLLNFYMYINYELEAVITEIQLSNITNQSFAFNDFLQIISEYEKKINEYKKHIDASISAFNCLSETFSGCREKWQIVRSELVSNGMIRNRSKQLSVQSPDINICLNNTDPSSSINTISSPEIDISKLIKEAMAQNGDTPRKSPVYDTSLLHSVKKKIPKQMMAKSYTSTPLSSQKELPRTFEFGCKNLWTMQSVSAKKIIPKISEQVFKFPFSIQEQRDESATDSDISNISDVSAPELNCDFLDSPASYCTTQSVSNNLSEAISLLEIPENFDICGNTTAPLDDYRKEQFSDSDSDSCCSLQNMMKDYLIN